MRSVRQFLALKLAPWLKPRCLHLPPSSNASSATTRARIEFAKTPTRRKP